MCETRYRVTKVLLISFVQPFPADDGKKAVLQGMVRYFLARPNTRVDYMILRETGPGEPQAPQLTFHPVRNGTRRTQPLTAVIRSIVRQRPLQQTMLYSDSLRRAICQQMVSINPDIVIYDTFRVSQFIEDPHALLPNAKHILYLDDLFSVRYQAMLQAMDEYPALRVEPLGNFARHLPAVWRPMLNARRLCRFLLRREMQLVKTVEAGAVAKFDVSLLANRAEVKLLRERSGQDKIAVLPIVLPPHQTPVLVRNYQGSPEFIFIGSLNVAHNQCSLEHFITDVFDACMKSIPGIKLRIIGHAPSTELHSLFARYPESIEWTAWIADLGGVFARCAAMIVPLLFGSGVKVKTLEALRHALPVVSTRFGAEGIVSNPTDASGIIIEDDVQRFPQHMQSLLDPRENHRLSNDARDYYAAHFGAEASAQQYEALFGV